MSLHPNISANLKNAHSSAFSTGISASQVNFARIYSGPALAGAGDFKQGDVFDGASTVRRVELSAMSVKHCKGQVTVAQGQDPTPCVMDHAGGLEHHMLHHCLDAATIGLVAYRCIGLVRGVLSSQAQQVHRHCRRLAHQIVGIEFVRGQPFQIQCFLQQTFALTCTCAHPLRSRSGNTPGVDGVRGRGARVLLDVESALTRIEIGLRGNGLHQFQRIKVRVCTHHQKRGHQNGGHWQGAFKVVFSLGGSVLYGGSQYQFQTIALAAQIQGKRAITVDPGISASHELLPVAVFVHCEGIEIDGGVAALHGTEVYGLPIDTAAQQQLTRSGCLPKPGGRMGVHALAQGRAQWRSAKTQCTFEKASFRKLAMAPKALLPIHSRARKDLRIALLATPERTGNLGSIRTLTLTRLRHLLIETRPAW